jgi:hypothetical protein
VKQLGHTDTDEGAEKMAAYKSAGLCEGRFWGTVDENRGCTLGERSTTDFARREAARTNI